MWFIDNLRFTILSRLDCRDRELCTSVWHAMNDHDAFGMESDTIDHKQGGTCKIIGSQDNRWQRQVSGQMGRIDVIDTAILPPPKYFADLKHLSTAGDLIDAFCAHAGSALDSFQHPIERIAIALQAKQALSDEQAAVDYVYREIIKSDHIPPGAREIAFKVNMPIMPESLTEVFGHQVVINQVQVWSSVVEQMMRLDVGPHQSQHLLADPTHALQVQLDINNAPISEQVINQHQRRELLATLQSTVIGFFNDHAGPGESL